MWADLCCTMILFKRDVAYILYISSTIQCTAILNFMTELCKCSVFNLLNQPIRPITVVYENFTFLNYAANILEN